MIKARLLYSHFSLPFTGNHGDGERANTETPLILWGAGVRNPQLSAPPPGIDQSSWTVESPPSWRIDHLRYLSLHVKNPCLMSSRVDVEQADIASLMSSLIGVPFPVNSVGILPVDYLAMSEKEKAHRSEIFFLPCFNLPAA